jgi:parallel beta-helix repeat protein
MMKQINIHRLPGSLRTYTAVSGAILFATSGLFSVYGDQRPSSGYRSVDPPVTTAVPAVARFAQRYYVSPKGSDSNDGSQAQPWATISRAATQARAGAIIVVLPGSYVSPGEIKTKASGTASARITFISETQWGAILISTEKGNSAVWNNIGNYIDIMGFDVTGSGSLGIYNRGSHVRIIGNYIHDIPARGCGENGGAGVNNGDPSAQDDDVIGNVVNNVGDYQNPCQRVHGIYYSNLGGHALENVVYRNQGWGIHAWHAASRTVIANNSVFNNGYGGILIGAGDDPGRRPNDHTVVANNIVYRNGLNPKAGGYGIEEFGKTGTHNLYLNNLVHQNGPANWHLQNGNKPSGSVDADPRFVNYTGDSTGDYHLQSTSPGLRKGTRRGVPIIELRTGDTSFKPNLGAYTDRTAPNE